MAVWAPERETDQPGLAKAPTGISGLDEITRGGLPKGRPTLICGAAGAGKTVLAVSFLVHGTEMFGEPGVLMTFEENAREIADDVASLGFDLQKLIADRKLGSGPRQHLQCPVSEYSRTPGGAS